MVTIKDIARVLSISPATVSLALNGNDNVSSETADKVKRTAEEMGYVRNRFARSLVCGKSGTIALVVPDIENPYFASLVKHVTSIIDDYDVLISISNESETAERNAVKKLAKENVEAILLAPVNKPLSDTKYSSWLENLDIPLVFISAKHGCINRPVVMCDLCGGMHELTMHVAGTGVKRIALLTGPENVFTLDLRKQGFVEAAMQTGFVPNIYYLPEVTYRAAYEKAFNDISRDMPDALICVNDMMALGVVNAFSAKGIRVPDDILVAGFDDSIFAAVSEVPLTTVVQDISQIAAKSVETTKALIRGATVEQEQFIKCRLVERVSTSRNPMQQIHDE